MTVRPSPRYWTRDLVLEGCAASGWSIGQLAAAGRAGAVYLGWVSGAANVLGSEPALAARLALDPQAMDVELLAPARLAGESGR
jgi:hypothetical protein